MPTALALNDQWKSLRGARQPLRVREVKSAGVHCRIVQSCHEAAQEGGVVDPGPSHAGQASRQYVFVGSDHARWSRNDGHAALDEPSEYHPSCACRRTGVLGPMRSHLLHSKDQDSHFAPNGTAAVACCLLETDQAGNGRS